MSYFVKYKQVMKQVEKIWAELSAKAQEVETPQESTELSEEVKVELALQSDAEQLIKKMDSMLSKQLQLRTQASKLAREGKDWESEYDSLANKGEAIVKEATKQLNILGVKDEPSWVFKIAESIGDTKDIMSLLRKEFN